MLKRNIRVLVSFFCVVASCILTVVFLFVNEDGKMDNHTVLSVSTKSSTTLSDKLEIVEVNLDGSDTLEEDTNADDTVNYDQEDDLQDEVFVPEKVYEDMTLDELANKLDRSLMNELNGKGYLYASYSLEKGVDPYLAVAISLEETGCNWNCSNLVKSCNNVGGMKGSGCGSYGYFASLDDGIRAFIDNIARNYVAYGLTTAELMNSKYAENPAWSSNVNNYITKIKNN